MIFYKFHLEINERKILIGDEKIPIFAIQYRFLQTPKFSEK